MSIQIQRPIQNEFHYVLHRLFDYPSVVLIGGTWKSGKTDFALFLSEHLLKLPFKAKDNGIVNEVASNIDTSGHYPQVYDQVSLKQWLYHSNKRKLYIFDEASEHLPSRRAMSGKNVGFLQLIPQVSKAHARMIVVGHQLLKIDKDILDDIWCRGVFIKSGLKKAELYSHLLSRPYAFKDIPATSIPFDPYTIAPFQENPPGGIMFKDKDKQLLWDWCHGSTIQKLGIHANSLNRLVRKYMRDIMERESHTLQS